VRQSSGQVRICSEPGKGTQVCLYLPRHSGIEDRSEAPTVSRKAQRIEGSATVLVVDDEPLVRMLVTDVLEELGHIAIETGDATAGMSVLQGNARIDLLITDIGLPGIMNGRQLAQAARELRRDLTVLFISGYEASAARGPGPLDSRMHVMTKPFTVAALAARINDLIAAMNDH
jgi:CheY-like chemotaxis protein